jgi:hypothetical protein
VVSSQEILREGVRLKAWEFIPEVRISLLRKNKEKLLKQREQLDERIRRVDEQIKQELQRE